FLEVRRDLQQDRRSQSLDQCSVANELDRVAEALLASQEDRLATQILTIPHGSAKWRPQRQKRVPEPSEFVIVPAFAQSPCREKCEAVSQMALDIGSIGQLALQHGECVLDVSTVDKMRYPV